MTRHLPLSKVTPCAVAHVAKHTRKADRDEVKAASGREPLDVLREGVDLSTESYVLRTPEKEPAAILGVVPASIGGWGEVGAIWMLGTDAIQKHRFHFHRACLPFIDSVNRRWGVLANLVDARNLLHIRWLRSLGFTFSAPVIAGVEQRPFIPFTRTLNV